MRHVEQPSPALTTCNCVQQPGTALNINNKMRNFVSEKNYIFDSEIKSK